MKQLRRQLGVLWGTSYSALGFSLLGYKGDESMSQLLQLVRVGDVETRGGVRHPRNSGGTSGSKKQISSGK